MSQGQQVMADIKRIRAALAKLEQGSYRLQKLPRQAVWLVHGRNSKVYRLTFQTAPFNTWTLHPPDRETSELLGKIEQALSPSASSIGVSTKSGQSEAVSDQAQVPLDRQQPSLPTAYKVEAPSTYNQLLHPWLLFSSSPNIQRRTVARFRRRNDADAQLKAMRQLSPLAQYTVVFKPARSLPGFAPEEHGEVFA